MSVASNRKRLLLVAAALATGLPAPAALATADQHAGLPETIILTGVIRDFKARDEGGHPDFQRRPDAGFGHYVYMVADDLDDDGKPVFNSQGYKLFSNWTDAQGNPISPPREHLAERQGDSAGSVATSTGGALTTASNFAQWFRDVPGVNVSRPHSITLRREAGSNVYVFDDKQDPKYKNLGGFFPIDNELFGNYGSTGRNFHFTYEIETEFIYRAGAGQVFTFIGDDDVWVFIDGKCVIDIGGVHSAIAQTIDLDRLDWLEDGQKYQLKFFFAERHTTQSNFRIETSLNLRSVNLPATAALFD